MCAVEVDRRTFIKGGVAALGLLMVGSEIVALAAEDDEDAVQGPPIKLGLIGAGTWGRTLLSNAVKLPCIKVVSVCDTYAAYITKCKEIAPNVAACDDYRKMLDAKDIEAVIIATPSHQHKEIALAAIQAGKHVYCEAPLAHNAEDCRSIANAAVGTKQVFQVGIQGRSNPLYKDIFKFVKSGVLGIPVQVHAHWNKKQSWRRAAPTPAREAELNWRLNKQTSAGLISELGMHQLDIACWYLDALPVSATGFSSIQKWKDGRDVPDTVQSILEFPKNVNAMLSMSLATSCGGSFTLIQGTSCSLMLRENRAWMVKEADSPILGWEIYARKEPCNGDTGICLVADATKLVEEGKDPGKVGNVILDHDPVYFALRDFARSIREQSKIACGITEGMQSTLVAIKANESVLNGGKLVFDSSYLAPG